MQALRHIADYDPDPEEPFTRTGVLEHIEEFENAPASERRAFAIYVLLRLRSG